MNVFLHKGTQVWGGFLALGRDTKKLFPLTCRGGESRAKEGAVRGVTIGSRLGIWKTSANGSPLLVD